MEEIIETLRAYNENVPIPLDLPDEDDLIDVEEQLFLTLPSEYREFLLTVSDVVYGALEPATAADPQSHTYIPELAATAWDEGLPRHLIPICKSEPGYYCIDPDGVVGYWTKKGFSEDEWDSIWEWVNEIWLGNKGR
jgi:hypothetical protein